MLEINGVTLRLGGKALIQSFSLSIKPGEIVTLMGPSGSGKSSLLSFIGGTLHDAFSASGEVVLDGLRIDHLPPQRRQVARLFQDDLLFPHMTVGENLLFAIPRAPALERLQAMREALSQVGLAGYESRAPHQLSGGQRSRVALMRALLSRPKAILLDEPFNKLDQDLRKDVRNGAFRTILSQNIPALLVSHDAEDRPKGGRLARISGTGEVSLV